MSIFPKRTVPGKGVTIHWNYNTAHLKGTHIFPFVRIGVKRPDGKMEMLCEQHILALPNPEEVSIEETETKTAYKYLNKNTPLLVLADYLSGTMKREKLFDILSTLQSGRHFYFHYQVPDNMLLGKYELISEVHSNGRIRYSKTAADDYFFVEKIQLKEIMQQNGHFVAHVQNLSPEPVPAKVLQCLKTDNGFQTKAEVFEIPANTEMAVKYNSEKTFLLYNEEREVMPLIGGSGIFSLRNQQLLSLSKKEEAEDVIFVTSPKSEVSFKLNGISRETWLKADGLTGKSEFEKNDVYNDVYTELVQSGLISEIRF